MLLFPSSTTSMCRLIRSPALLMRLSFLLPSLHGGCILVCLEGAQPGPLPAGAEVAGVGITCAAELPGQIKECAEQGGAVIVQQLHQVGLGDEAAQLDQVPGALAPRLGPIAGIGAGAYGVQPDTCHCQPPQPYRCRLQLRQ